MDIAGKTALITGGARMGHAVAEILARRGCAVALTYRSSVEAAESTRYTAPIPRALPVTTATRSAKRLIGRSPRSKSAAGGPMWPRGGSHSRVPSGALGTGIPGDRPLGK